MMRHETSSSRASRDQVHQGINAPEQLQNQHTVHLLYCLIHAKLGAPPTLQHQPRLTAISELWRLSQGCSKMIEVGTEMALVALDKPCGCCQETNESWLAVIQLLLLPVM